MKIEAMDTPDTREEFENRFHILIEQIRKDKFHAPRSIGLEDLRKLPNGRLDMLSINESARLQANMMSHFSKEKMQDLLEERDKEEFQDD